jgi:hypothetical protein
MPSNVASAKNAASSSAIAPSTRVIPWSACGLAKQTPAATPKTTTSTNPAAADPNAAASITSSSVSRSTRFLYRLRPKSLLLSPMKKEKYIELRGKVGANATQRVGRADAVGNAHPTKLFSRLARGSRQSR